MSADPVPRAVPAAFPQVQVLPVLRAVYLRPPAKGRQSLGQTPHFPASQVRRLRLHPAGEP